MKKKLLYFTSIVLFSTISISAQTQTWDFGNASAFTNTTGYSNETVIQKLGVFPGSGTTNMGQSQSDNTTPNTNWTTDGITYTQKFKLNGTSAPTGNLPTKRYVYFTVDGPCTVKLWFKTNTAGTQRSAFISDGASKVASAISVADFGFVSFDYDGTGGKIYVYSDASINLYNLQVSGANVTTPTLGTNTYSKESDVTVYSNNNKVLFSNIKSKTSVSVYGLTGALVKSADVNEDSSVNVEKGIYIVKLQSAEGQKAVKVIVQ